jgi:hypothetical protein
MAFHLQKKVRVSQGLGRFSGDGNPDWRLLPAFPQRNTFQNRRFTFPDEGLKERQYLYLGFGLDCGKRFYYPIAILSHTKLR